MTGKNIGDLLNDKSVTWGWFQGGFTADRHAPTATRSAAPPTTNVGGNPVGRLQPAPQRRSSTTSRRPTRTTCRRPRSPTIGHTDQANHQYDLTDFDAALKAGNLPAVSFLKARRVPGRPRRLLRPARRAALPGRARSTRCSSRRSGGPPRSSSPTTTPTAGTTTSTPPIINGSADAGPRRRRRCCGSAPVGRRLRRPLRPRPAAAAAGHLARTARSTTSTTPATDQTSILKFIEDNWGTGRIGDASFDARAELADRHVRLPPRSQQEAGAAQPDLGRGNP